MGPLLSRGGRCDGTVRACFGHLLLNSNCALQSSTVDQGRLCEVVSARTAGYGGVFLYRRFHFVSRYRERKTVVSGFRGLSTPCQRQACCSFPNADNSCVTGHAGSLSERELDHPLYGHQAMASSRIKDGELSCRIRSGPAQWNTTAAHWTIRLPEKDCVLVIAVEAAISCSLWPLPCQVAAFFIPAWFMMRHDLRVTIWGRHIPARARTRPRTCVMLPC